MLAGLGLALAIPLSLAAGESPAALRADAKVSEQDAKMTALARVPNGTIQTTALEKEHGRLVWSFDIARATSKDLTEVQVDAKTGKVATVKKETPAQEAQEKKSEKPAAKQGVGISDEVGRSPRAVVP
jgi:ABC-type xylose transport system substrate-binding protein